MRCDARVLALASALALLAAPAAADPGGTLFDPSVRATVALASGGGKTYAVITLESRSRLRLTGWMDLYVNGNQLPVGEVSTDGQLILAEAVQAGATPPLACVHFDGWLEPPDGVMRHVERFHCAGDDALPAPPLGAQAFVAPRPFGRPASGD